jgi:splicing factor 3B subunit 1
MPTIEEQIKLAKSARSSDKGKDEKEGQREDANDGVKFGGARAMDEDVYGGATEYNTELMDMEEDSDDNVGAEGSDDDDDDEVIDVGKSIVEEDEPEDSGRDIMEEAREENGSGIVNTRISARESDYHKRKYDRTSHDVDSEGNQMSYGQVMEKVELERQEKELQDKVAKVREKEELEGKPRRRRWDDAPAAADEAADASAASSSSAAPSASRWDEDPQTAIAAKPRRRRWDATPSGAAAVDETPKASRWDETPAAATATKKRSRWDATPAQNAAAATISKLTAATPASSNPAEARANLVEQEMALRNQPISDAELDAVLPQTGYRILDPPPDYKPAHRTSSNLLATPTPVGMTPGFMIQNDAVGSKSDYGIALGATGTVGDDGLPFIKQEDYQYFGKLMDNEDESTMSKVRDGGYGRLGMDARTPLSPQPFLHMLTPPTSHRKRRTRGLSWSFSSRLSQGPPPSARPP